MNHHTEHDSAALSNKGSTMKRIFDLCLVIILSPIAILLSAVFSGLFWLSTRESPFFIQTRIGIKQEPFTLYKLRTMPKSTQNIPTHEMSSEKIPIVGRIMRAIKVDELPQLINVLKGEMSIVGPRPCLPTQNELIAQRYNRGVYSVLPGITGLAQVLGIDMSDPAALSEADQRYVDDRTIWLDIKLIIQTLLGSGSGDRTV